MKLLMLCSEDIIPVKLLVVLMASKLSRILPTGLEPGLLKVKVWLTAQNLCKSLERTLHTLLLLTQGHLNYLFHLMFSRRSVKNGQQLYPSSIARPIRLSATFRNLARLSLTKWSLLVSKWVIIFLKLIPNNIYTSPMKASASSLFTSADCQVRIRTCFWLVTHSWDTSTRYMISIGIKFH